MENLLKLIVKYDITITDEAVSYNKRRPKTGTTKGGASLTPELENGEVPHTGNVEEVLLDLVKFLKV
jgi:hypothetical protein